MLSLRTSAHAGVATRFPRRKQLRFIFVIGNHVRIRSLFFRYCNSYRKEYGLPRRLRLLAMTDNLVAGNIVFYYK